MNVTHRLARRWPGLVVAAVLTCGFATPAIAAAPSATTAFAVVGDRMVDGHATDLGAMSSTQMSVEVALAPRDEAGLNRELAAVYDPASKQYQHWLAKNQFAERYAPSSGTRDSVVSYLRSNGLTVTNSASPFLVRAVGSSAAISTAFRTSLHNFRSAGGVSYFANSASVQLPKAIAPGVLGVIGLTDTARLHSSLVSAHSSSATSSTVTPSAAALSTTAPSSCEDPYPTAQQIFAAGGVFLRGYGGAPGCNGLTPSQVNSIYDAPHVGPRGAGAGATLAVFEESSYRHSDIATWTKQFFGPNFHAPLTDINVDGGPLNPACPAGDVCPPELQGFAGDIEVDSDIDMQLTAAPDAAHILVYNAPGDFTDLTALDEYTRMASDDLASSISESYGDCEADVSPAFVQAENVVFEQMALQGQSMFGALADSGAFASDCLVSEGTTIVNIPDPPGQPWVTAVGGTSLASDNPGTNEHPAYPTGVETAWNPRNLCNASPDEGGESGFFWCSFAGAGGGGSSQFWGRPSYQRGPGIDNPGTTHANGTTQCALAATGTPCREVPDVTANADGFNGYGIFCTGDATTPNSLCATPISTPVGWEPVGGTSLSTPLWSGIAADQASFQGHRVGNINPLVYRLYRTDPQRYFHDITGIGPLQSVSDNNGLFPARPGYDLATGIGTPNMTPLITTP
jgi:subtilase family serine protease